MAVDRNVAPVIIKRKKVIAGGGHHGGAWKVAYADFVTAMMAFFMLMWLLNATTEKQRKGLADYFSPTISINRVSGGGDGAFGGDSVVAENTLPHLGTSATSDNPTEADQARGATGTSPDSEAQKVEQERLQAIEAALQGQGGESMLHDNLKRHVTTRLTDEGLVVELFETEDARLFDTQNAPTPLLVDLADVIVRVSDLISNPLAIEAHTQSFPLVLAENPVWDVSGVRANSMRALMTQGGMEQDRFQRVAAHADRERISPNPMSVRNNRLEVIFLRTDR